MTERKKPKKASRSKGGRAARNAAAALPAMHARFVQEYLADPSSATAAYKRAGYTSDGQAARTAAARLLKSPAIKAAIDAARDADARKYEITRERVLAEYAKLAFTDPRKFFRDDGSLKHPTELDDATAAALSQFEVEEEYIGDDPEVELEPQPHGGGLKRAHARTLAVGRTAKIKWHDKRGALDSIVKMMGWAKEQPLGTPENPVMMMIQDMQGRRSALVPVQHDEDDDA